MKKQIAITLLMMAATVPVSLFADTTPPTCMGQPFQSLMTQCLSPGASGTAACEALIQNNCFYNDPNTGAFATMQLAQVHAALAQQFTLQAGQGGSVGASAPAESALPIKNVNMMSTSQTSTAVKPAMSKEVAAPTAKPKQTSNYWF